jgi:hypothetical protein
VVKQFSAQFNRRPRSTVEKKQRVHKMEDSFKEIAV